MRAVVGVGEKDCFWEHDDYYCVRLLLEPLALLLILLAYFPSTRLTANSTSTAALCVGHRYSGIYTSCNPSVCVRAKVYPSSIITPRWSTALSLITA